MRSRLATFSPELAWLITLGSLLSDRLGDRRRDRGSVTLEQVAIAAALLAIALGASAVIAKVVVGYTGKLK
jgi:hypothetical protein